jgi:hypothetical protein
LKKFNKCKVFDVSRPPLKIYLTHQGLPLYNGRTRTNGKIPQVFALAQKNSAPKKCWLLEATVVFMPQWFFCNKNQGCCEVSAHFALR